MPGIIFEPFTPSETPSYGSARLPALRGYATAIAGIAGRGVLPALRQSAGYVRHPPQRLPALVARGAVLAAGVTSSGFGGYGRLPALRGYATASTLIPAITYAFGVLPKLTGAASAHYEMQSEGDAALPALKARAFIGATILGAGVLPALGGYGYIAAAASMNGISLLQSPGYLVITTSSQPVFALTESLIVRGTIHANWIQTMREGLRLDGQPLPLLEALASCSDGFGFGSMVSIAYRMLMQESASFAASPIGSMTFALQVADALAMVGGVGSQLDAQVAVAAALVLGDSHANVYPLTLDAGLDMSASAGATLRAVLKVLDALRMQAAATPGVTWLVQHAENVELGAGLSASAELNAAIREGLGILGEINLPDGAYLAWVVNTETRAFVKYRNFPFNSFARIGNSYFGASADGIYRLGGDSDAGEPIAATVRGALSDYGGSRMKRMPACYVGYRADDVMLLKVAVTNKDGDREEHVYRMESRPAQSMRVNRVKLGRGLKSTYWGWELTNIEGADFALDSFRWYPVVLERRL